MKAKTELWQRALSRRARNTSQRKRDYERAYRRRVRFELKIQRMRAIFTRVEDLAELLLCAKMTN